MNGRPSSPVEGENGMPNVPGNMMIQNAFQPNMNNGQFRQNGAMPQKPMQPGMANGMMNMGNAGSPMMQGMTPQQFNENIQLEIFNPRGASASKCKVHRAVA